jgi:hypothetical protein
MSDISMKPIRATKNLLTILYACANSRLPNGVEWDPFLPLCEPIHRERAVYILCCGHVVSPKYADKLLAHGIMQPGPPDRFNRPTITIAEAGRAMLAANIGRLAAEFEEASV